MQDNSAVRKITTGFQITIPTDFRKENNLHIGSMVSVHTENGKLIVEPFQHKSEALKKLKALFAQDTQEFEKLSEKEISQTITKETKLYRKNK